MSKNNLLIFKKMDGGGGGGGAERLAHEVPQKVPSTPPGIVPPNPHPPTGRLIRHPKVLARRIQLHHSPCTLLPIKCQTEAAYSYTHCAGGNGEKREKCVSMKGDGCRVESTLRSPGRPAHALTCFPVTPLVPHLTRPFGIWPVAGAYEPRELDSPSGLCCCTCYVFRALINSLVCSLFALSKINILKRKKLRERKKKLKN